MSASKYYDITWYCDGCNACLSDQEGFYNDCGSWTCTVCGYVNSIEEKDILEDEHCCPNCGANLKKQLSYDEYSYNWTCTECDAVLHRNYSGSVFSVVDESDICPSCEKSLLAQSGYDSFSHDWTCTECGAVLHRDYLSDAYTIVEKEDKCPICGSVLWEQSGYSSDDLDWTCTECNCVLHRSVSGIEFSPREEDEDDEENANDEGVRYSREPRVFVPIGSASHQRAHKQSNGNIRKKRLLSMLFFKKNIPVELSSTALCQMSVDEIQTILYNCGFKHIRIVEKKDVDGKTFFQENRVERVTINHISQFEAFSQFPYTAEIEIIVHRKKQIRLPYSASSLKRRNYEDVFGLLYQMGFTNIQLSQISDVILGLFVKDGAVETITINGNSQFKKNQVFPFDSSIEIIYHVRKW